MASLIQPQYPLTQTPTSLAYSYPSASPSSPPSSSSSVTRVFALRSTNLPKLRSASRRGARLSRSAANEDVSVTDPPPGTSTGIESAEPQHIASLKLKLLSAVSGLNRGLAANEDDQKNVDRAAKELEAAGGEVDLSAGADRLQGRWKLVYSSAFSSRTLGGSRPGPPIGRLLPLTLGQVWQRIDVVSADFDNIVELQLGTPWPLPPVELTATLAHKFEVTGSGKIRIKFEKTTVRTGGNLSQLPPVELPRLPDVLRQSSERGRGEFEVTFLDSDTRITRGDRAELRVFVVS